MLNLEAAARMSHISLLLRLQKQMNHGFFSVCLQAQGHLGGNEGRRAGPEAVNQGHAAWGSRPSTEQVIRTVGSQARAVANGPVAPASLHATALIHAAPRTLHRRESLSTLVERIQQLSAA